MKINLHVERLVLEGLELTPRERRLLQETASAELARLLHEGGLAPFPAGGLDISRLQAPSISPGVPRDPVALGEAIARSLYGGLAR
jgi:hypothetical protein